VSKLEQIHVSNHISGLFQRLIDGGAAGSTAHPDPTRKEIQRMSAGYAAVGTELPTPTSYIIMRPQGRKITITPYPLSYPAGGEA